MLPRSRALVLLVLAACSSPPGPQAPAAARTSSPLLDEIGVHFGSARKWFGMVRDLELDVAPSGELVPRFSTLRSELVRRTDAGGQSLEVRLPATAGGAHTITLTGSPDVWVRATEPAAGAVRAEVQSGVVVYRGALAGGDLLYKLTPTHEDEYVYLRAPPPSLSRRVELETGPGASLRQTPESVEVVDVAGAARLRVSAPVARAADGKRRRGTIRLDGRTLVLDIDLRGLAAPVLVDPDWTTTGTMTVGHWMGGAWLLPDGDAVVAGGCALTGCPPTFARPACGQVLADTEIWNAGSGTWSAGMPLGTPRFSFASLSLDGGDLLAIGGCTTTGCDTTTATVDRFVARAARWQSLGTLSSPRAHAAAAVLPGGDVLVAGGCDAPACTGAVDRLVAASGTWRAAGALATPRGFATATPLGDGRVLVVGGCADPACATPLGSAEVYDPAADHFAPAGALATPRAGHTATLLRDGTVLVAGGCADADCMRTLATAELWRPSTAAFEAAPAMPGPRHDHTATTLATGEVLLAGGASGATTSLPSAAVYVPSQARWLELENMNLDRAYHAALVLPSHDVLIAGGCNPTTCMPWAETFSPSRLPSLEADAGAPDAGALDAGPGDASLGDAGPVVPPPRPTSPHPAAYRTGSAGCADDTTQGLACPVEAAPMQDGEFQPNAHAYVVRDDEVLDSQTGLVWQAADGGDTVERDAAAARCAALSTAHATSGEWRLPTIVELTTLFDSGQQMPSIAAVFAGTAPDNYWSATPVSSGTAQGWTAKFDFGEVVPMLATHALRARCVRGTFAGGRLRQAGALTVGASTLSDAESGLEWQRAPDGVRHTWSEALATCAALRLDGKTGWHLPTANELRGLVDYGSTAPVRTDPLFTGVRGDTYWSSTPTFGIATLAQAVSFNLGVQDGVSVDSPAYALCVRHLELSPPPPAGGCGCVAAGARGAGGVAALLALVALATRVGRRRASRRRAPLPPGRAPL